LSYRLLDAIILIYKDTICVNRLYVFRYRELVLEAARGADDPAIALVWFEYY